MFKKITDAWVIVLLGGAVFHIVATMIAALVTQNPDAANVFNIIGVSIILPFTGHGLGWMIISLVFIAVMYGLAFAYVTKKPLGITRKAADNSAGKDDK